MNERPEALERLLDESRIKKVPRGQIIFHVGDEPQDAFMVKDGVIKIYDIDEIGNEKILHLIGAGGFMPFEIFYGYPLHTQWFYTSLIESELYRIPCEELQQTMLDDTATAMYMMNWYSQEVHELLVRLDSMGRTNVKDKLLAALRFLAVCHSVTTRSGWLRVKFPVSHQLLADLTGITRESAAAAMKELADAEMVRSPKLTVLEINGQKLLL